MPVGRRRKLLGMSAEANKKPFVPQVDGKASIQTIQNSLPVYLDPVKKATEAIIGILRITMFDMLQGNLTDF